MPLASYTAGPVQVALAAGVPTPIVPARMDRVGLIITNGSSLGSVYLAFGGVDPSATRYSYKLAPGDQWVLPLYGAVQELRAYATTLLALTAGLTYTEFSLAPV